MQMMSITGVMMYNALSSMIAMKDFIGSRLPDQACTSYIALVLQVGMFCLPT